MPTGSTPWASAVGTEIRVRYDDDRAAECISTFLRRHLRPRASALAAVANTVVLCIGTDRSTGDALGPLVGQRLAGLRLAGAAVLGTLDQPVHATNLEAVLDHIARRYEGASVLAIDACLGPSENVGSIALGRGPLRPGAGVNKHLPPVGDFYITGTVNVGGMMEYLVLQNTRLSLVMRMADIIARGVAAALVDEGDGAHAWHLPAVGP